MPPSTDRPRASGHPVRSSWPLSGWRDGDEAAQSRRVELSKQKQFLGVRIGNLTDLIADGSKSARSLLDKLVEIEEQRDAIEAELRRLDAEIKASTFKRATADEVQGFWSEFTALWPELTEAEKKEAIGLVVKRIEVKEKDRIYLELEAIGGKHGLKFLTDSNWEPRR